MKTASNRRAWRRGQCAAVRQLVTSRTVGWVVGVGTATGRGIPHVGTVESRSQAATGTQQWFAGSCQRSPWRRPVVCVVGRLMPQRTWGSVRGDVASPERISRSISAAHASMVGRSWKSPVDAWRPRVRFLRPGGPGCNCGRRPRVDGWDVPDRAVQPSDVASSDVPDELDVVGPAPGTVRVDQLRGRRPPRHRRPDHGYRRPAAGSSRPLRTSGS